MGLARFRFLRNRRATRAFAGDLVSYFRVGARNGATGFDLLLSFALFGIGHLIGLWVGLRCSSAR